MSSADIFKTKSRWVTYRATYRVETLVGGIPKNPDTIRAWLKARLELGEAEILAIAEEVIAQMAWTTKPTSAELDEVVDAVMEKASPKGNSFKMVGDQLVWEGRNLKAAFKEAANALYEGTRPWPGAPRVKNAKGDEVPGTRKGLRSYLEERVEVVDRYIPLGRTVPDITGEQRIKHVTVPGQGKRSSISVVDICENVEFVATIKVLDDCISPELWGEIWSYVELGGIGADRARGDGRGELLKWENLTD